MMIVVAHALYEYSNQVILQTTFSLSLSLSLSRAPSPHTFYFLFNY